MKNPIDVNALRRIMLESQSKGEVYPVNPLAKLHVDNRGNVLQGSTTQGWEVVTEVPQDTFATRVTLSAGV